MRSVSEVLSSRRTAGVFILATLMLPLWGTPAEAAEDYTVQSDKTFTFVGRGYGHCFLLRNGDR